MISDLQYCLNYLNLLLYTCMDNSINLTISRLAACTKHVNEAGTRPIVVVIVRADGRRYHQLRLWNKINIYDHRGIISNSGNGCRTRLHL